MLARLFPTAYAEDEEAAAEFRRFTEGDAARRQGGRGRDRSSTPSRRPGLPPELGEQKLVIDVELDEPAAAGLAASRSPTCGSRWPPGSRSSRTTRTSGRRCPTTTRGRRRTTSTTGSAPSRRPWSTRSALTARRRRLSADGLLRVWVTADHLTHSEESREATLPPSRGRRGPPPSPSPRPPPTAALTVPGLALAHGGHGSTATPCPRRRPTRPATARSRTSTRSRPRSRPTTATPSRTRRSRPGRTARRRCTSSRRPAPTPSRPRASRQGRALPGQARAPRDAEGHVKHASTGHAKPAILFDIDDTTLNTYSYEIYSSFVYNPTTNAAFVNAGSASVFPAVPGMVDLEQKAHRRWLHGVLPDRPPAIATTDQKPAPWPTCADAGYTVRRQPGVPQGRQRARPSRGCRTCAPTCTTTQYKSLTRQHIESLGYDIVANFGDQFSDLNGGFADKTFKMPNPMYFLP